MAEYNPGFAFYDTYYKAIENLPIEQQKEICYAYVKYGITYEMVDSVEMPLGYAFVTNNKENIRNSVDRWITNQNKANFKADANISKESRIAQLIAEGKKSIEIAEIITLEGNKISDSAVRRSMPWKERNEPNFCEKWLGNSVKIHKNAQNGTCENVVNCENAFTQNCENSQNFTEQERTNSQNWDF